MPVRLNLRSHRLLLAVLLAFITMPLLGGCSLLDFFVDSHTSVTETAPVFAPGDDTELSNSTAKAHRITAETALPDYSESVTGADRAEPSADNLQRAADYSRARDGDALIVMTAAGRVLFERYGADGGAEKPHRLASGTKTFWGLLAVAAAQDGVINLDERVANTITEWQSDPRKSRITVRQLLNFTSGLDPAIATLRGNPRSGNKFAQALQVPAVAEPGTTFTYGPSHLFVFGAWLERKLRAAGRRTTDPLAYLQERLLDPMGLSIGEWMRDADGHPIMPSGAHVAPREWIKIGQLIVNQGRWQGRALIKPEYLREIFQGSTANPAYGLTLWLNHNASASQSHDLADGANQRRLDRTDDGYIYREGPPDLVMAAGQGKQRLYVIPSRRLVILRQGNTRGGDWKDSEFLSILLTGQSVMGTVSPGIASRSVAGGTFGSVDGAAAQVRRDLRQACRDDVQRLCPDVIHDRPALWRCYQDLRQDFSIDCQQAVAAARDARRRSREAL
ncbi:serine hydrolase domain-containing protein [Rhabdochromatium marinum]|uniref:serine hydrolase domain-containing protein n=1 Tax=Rhabdochromatium marinum TaxID=48729 RepID=UPI001908A020|nr:serine hydrolase [Rhabdochromatium marinum]MBK1647700.1 hypothetical protein [Rhabdochromatium marinum]